MAFVDEINIKLSAGKGGDGVVRWRREKYKDKAGPSGGNGGRGGNVFVRSVRDIYRLADYAQSRELKAVDGEDGMKDSRTGANGEDLVLDFPIGSVVTNKETGERFEIINDEEVKILKGGRGGLGNEHFKSSRNVSPREQTDGKLGQEAEFYIELLLIADIGLVGFPNAGKSTLLNSLTGAKSKVGSYRFTTLEPHLGDLYGVIIADIPGLIEGASEGKGLGHSFLRHISRTRLLAFCISAESEDPVFEYEAVKEELRLYDPKMMEKPSIVIITKADVADEKKMKKITSDFKKKTNLQIHSVSILVDESLNKISKVMIDWVKELSSTKK